MAHDVALVELDGGNTRDTTKDTLRLYKARTHVARQIYLTHITSHNHTGTQAQSGEEHLDLGSRSVLRLVENDDSIAQRTTTHIGEWSNLNDVGFKQFTEFSRRYHILQGIIERLQIGIEFILHLTRQKAQFLTSLNSRTRKYNLAYLLIFQGSHGKSDGNVSFPRTSRAKGEAQIVLGEGINESLLILSSCGDRLAVHAIDNQAVLFLLHRALTIVETQDHLFVEFVVFVAIVDQPIDESLEHLNVVLIAINLDGPASRSETKLGVECLEQQDVRVVRTIKYHRIGLLQKNNFFYHGGKDTHYLTQCQIFVKKIMPQAGHFAKNDILCPKKPVKTAR